MPVSQPPENMTTGKLRLARATPYFFMGFHTRKAASLRSRRRLEGRTGVLASDHPKISKPSYNTPFYRLLADIYDQSRTLADNGGQKGQLTDKSGKSRTNEGHERSNGPFRLTTFRFLLLFTVRTIARPFFCARKPEPTKDIQPEIWKTYCEISVVSGFILVKQAPKSIIG